MACVKSIQYLSLYNDKVLNYRHFYSNMKEKKGYQQPNFKIFKINKESPLHAWYNNKLFKSTVTYRYRKSALFFVF